jgi:hypothetical protein
MGHDATSDVCPGGAYAPVNTVLYSEAPLETGLYVVCYVSSLGFLCSSQYSRLDHIVGAWLHTSASGTQSNNVSSLGLAVAAQYSRL